ncbi:MAG: ATP-binding protein, partial [Nannocystaceae bacterium]
MIIAADWAIQMLEDPQIIKLEIDATSLDPSGHPVVVDDVVVYRSTIRVYCQCKKNQPDFRAWSVRGLRDDLEKAAKQLVRDPSGEVHFYSCTEFGTLAKLREYAGTQPDAAAYTWNLEGKNKETDGKLSEVWKDIASEAGTNVYTLLRRVLFESTPTPKTYRERLLNRLGRTVTQRVTAYTILTARLDEVSRRLDPVGPCAGTSSVMYITRESLIAKLAHAGCLVTPSCDESELLSMCKRVSRIGRDWQREIDNTRILRPGLEQIRQHIAARDRSVLVEGGPGSGKTCVLLELVDQLERDPVTATIFIQATSFVDCGDEAALEARGLPAGFVGFVARMAEFRHAVVVIDSLDVLSTSHHQGVLRTFISILDQLEGLENVTVVAACRRFDTEYDARLSRRTWSRVIGLGDLDWERDVVPLLGRWHIAAESIASPLRTLLRVPRLLSLFREVTRRGNNCRATTAHELVVAYLDRVVRDEIGPDALAHVERMGAVMMEQRGIDLTVGQAGIPVDRLGKLLSAGVLIQTERGNPRCTHRQGRDGNTPREAPPSVSPLLWFFLWATPRTAPTPSCKLCRKGASRSVLGLIGSRVFQTRAQSHDTDPASRALHTRARSPTRL